MGGPMRCGSGGTPAGSIEHGKIVDVEGVASALRQLIARAEIQENRALIAASDALAVFRVLKFATSTTEQSIDSAVAKEFPLDPERMATRWTEVHSNGQQRIVYAAAWDRAQVRKVADTVKLAGLEPVVIDLKSACIARAVSEPACIVLDLSSDPAELFLIDSHLPQVWHSFKIDVPPGEDLGPALAAPLRSALRYYLRKKDSDFGSRSPILISGEQVIPSNVLAALSHALEHPVEPLLGPTRVPEEVRHATYLTCLGLIMRRDS
jgi:Type IV pilus assembly protein PilM